MKLSQAQKALEFLKSNPNQKFTARFIADKLIATYPQDYIEKRNNIKFENNEGAFKQQVIRELYSIFPDLIEKADSSGKCNSIKTSHNFTRCIPT